ncbi:MAG TPA: helix-turn-helix domain-containing protein [Thermoguttaceae bacterium]|nr:helix-turn-helix domain-containing protein [Thermoguttaceae bacterium]
METGCKTLRDFLRWLERQYDLLETIYQHGPPHHHPDLPEALPADGLPTETDDSFFVEMEAAQIVEEARRLACRFGGGHLVGEEVGTVQPREALGIVGKLLDWARQTVPEAATLTVTEAARLLRVNRDKVLGWIRSGLLPAANTANSQTGRPRYRIKRADLDGFLERRTSRPDAKPVRRRRVPEGVTRYFPEA